MHRIDARFWAMTIVACLALASLGCFGFAASQKVSDVPVLTTDFACPPPADL